MMNTITKCIDIAMTAVSRCRAASRLAEMHTSPAADGAEEKEEP
jgi:hypothetical protein